MMDLEKIAFWLLVIGGINWGLVALLSFNLVDLLGKIHGIVPKIAYLLVAAGAIYLGYKEVK
jgi:uncharacterized protein